MHSLDLFVDGIGFGEGPRWHDGQLWYSDFFQRAIYAVSPTGQRTAMFANLDDRPSGLGWLPDGRLLVVSMVKRKVLRQAAAGDATLVDHADLGSIATGHCNDMVVDAVGNAYVGNFGFDFEARGAFETADLALVRTDGSVEVAATGLRFPNGSVITNDGHTLIVGESYGAGYEAFTIADDGTLIDRRRWANVPGTAPDGCTLDADDGIWFSDALGSRVVRIVQGGAITHEILTPMPTFACALGGDDGRSLFVLCAPGTSPEGADSATAGAIYTTKVDAPHAGRP